MYRTYATLFIVLFVVTLVHGQAVAQPLQGELIGPFAKYNGGLGGVISAAVGPGNDIYIAFSTTRDDTEAGILAYRIASGEFERVAGNGELGDVTTGPALETPIHPNSIAFGPQGDLFFFNVERQSPAKLAKLRADGEIEVLNTGRPVEGFVVNDLGNVPSAVNQLDELFFGGGLIIGDMTFGPIIKRDMDGAMELYSGCMESECVSEGHRLQIAYDSPVAGLYADGDGLWVVERGNTQRGGGSVYKISVDGQASIVRTFSVSSFGGLGTRVAFVPDLGIIGQDGDGIIRFYSFLDDRIIDLGYPNGGFRASGEFPFVYHEATGDLYVVGWQQDPGGPNQYLFRVPNVGETIRAQLEAGVEGWEAYE